MKRNLPAKENISVPCLSVIGSFYQSMTYTCGREEYIELCTRSEGNEMELVEGGYLEMKMNWNNISARKVSGIR